jgi:HEAT repeat protein
VLALALLTLAPSVALAQRRASIRMHQAAPQDDEDEEETPEPVVEDMPSTPLRAHFGTDHAELLLRGADSAQVRQGIVRAAAAGTPEAVALIVAQATQGTNDDLTLIELARALAPFAKEEAPRTRLIAMLSAIARPGRATARSGAQREEGSMGHALALTTAASAARVEFARQIATRALVASHDPKALEAVFTAAKESGISQQNAQRALASDPSATASASILPPTAAGAARALAQTGDLRALDALLSKAQGNVETATRAASLIALGQLGDGRARAVAIASFADADAHVRAAAGETLVLLDAPERFHAVAALLASPDTAAAGIRLAHQAQDVDVVKALAARLAAVSEQGTRADIVAALGRGIATDEGLKLLVSVAGDPRLGGDAVQALARSPNASAMAALEQIAAQRAAPLRRLAVRGYVVRSLLRGDRSSVIDGVIDQLRASPDKTDRAVATFARVALGRASASASLDDHEPAIRRAAAMGSLAGYDGHSLPAQDELLSHLAREPDDATRTVLAIGLLGGDPHALVPTFTLLQRVEAGSADAPLSATALAARKGDSLKDKIDALAESTDPVMRAHVARGLGASEEPSATGRLAEAARYEGEPLVRLAQTTALARRSVAPVRTELLAITARFDPEARIRDVAARALANATPPAPWPVHEVAWLRVATAAGQPPAETMVASYVTSEGIAIPIAFDADGYALVAGIPPGDGRLILAPTLPAK